MLDLEIAVTGWNRPKHLYVALQSLFAVRGIEKYGVSVYIDGGAEPKVRTEIIEAAIEFPVHRTVTYGSNRGCLVNVSEAIRASFSYGCQYVFYIEDDMILRPDTLEYLEGVAVDTNFVNVFGASNSKEARYRSLGNMVDRETFSPLYDWIQAKEYAGTVRPDNNYRLSAETRSHDAVFYSYVAIHGLESLFPPKSYSGHFGITGLNQGRKRPELLELEGYMFSGDRHTWLPRIIRLLETRDHSVLRDYDHVTLIPKDYRYTDNEKGNPCELD